MIYKTAQPSPELAQYVRFFWMYEHAPEAGNVFVHRAMADTCAEMIFHYNNSFVELTTEGIKKSPAAHLQGQSNTVRRFSTAAAFGIFGVYLYPFALPILFPVSGTEICNQYYEFDTLTGISGTDLTEQVMLASNFEARIEIVSRFLMHRLKRVNHGKHNSTHLHSIRDLLQTTKNDSIKTIAANHGFSERKLERITREYTGFTPVKLFRIARFQKAAASFGHTKPRTLTQLALDCGYYDQAHFIHEFKLFSGYSPREYFFTPAEGTDYRY
jgi:AraC-like DNA-binding protein